MKKILFLYSSLNGFLLSTLKSIYNSNQCSSIDIIFWDKNTSGNDFINTQDLSFINFHKRSNFNIDNLKSIINKIKPDIIYISGWMDEGYLKALKFYRRTNELHKTVCGFDDQWRNSIRQIIGSLYFKIFLRKLFDIAWVSGAPQYHYARKMGFNSKNIIFNLLSADTALFCTKAPVNKRFVYVGRMEYEKGPDLLVEAYKKLSKSEQKLFPLVMIGSGSYFKTIQKNLPNGVKLLPYLQPKDLIKELSKGGVGCVPSRFEQWGVTIHEFALLGYPLIISSTCGAATEFLIDDYNGYFFNSDDLDSLVKTMKKIIFLDDEKFSKFSSSSSILGARINSEISSKSFLTVN